MTKLISHPSRWERVQKYKTGKAGHTAWSLALAIPASALSAEALVGTEDGYLALWLDATTPSLLVTRFITFAVVAVLGAVCWAVSNVADKTADSESEKGAFASALRLRVWPPVLFAMVTFGVTGGWSMADNWGLLAAVLTFGLYSHKSASTQLRAGLKKLGRARRLLATYLAAGTAQDNPGTSPDPGGSLPALPGGFWVSRSDSSTASSLPHSGGLPATYINSRRCWREVLPKLAVPFYWGAAAFV